MSFGAGAQPSGIPTKELYLRVMFSCLYFLSNRVPGLTALKR